MKRATTTEDTGELAGDGGASPQIDTYAEDLRRAEEAELQSEELGALPIGHVINGDPRYVYCHVGDIPHRNAKIQAFVAHGWTPCTNGELKVGFRGGSLIKKPLETFQRQAARKAAETRFTLAKLTNIVDRDWERAARRGMQV